MENEKNVQLLLKIVPMRIKRLAYTALIFIMAATSTLAQCSMCRSNLSNAENSLELSQRVNTAILVLLIPTLVIIGGLVRLVFKYRNAQGTYVNIRSTSGQRSIK
jgi:hypothetical protein